MSQMRAEGPPDCNLFIYHLPASWTDAILRKTFEGYGSIVSAVVMKDRATGLSKGFGFVSFDNPGTAQLAIQGENGKEVEGKFLKVQLKNSGKGAGPGVSGGGGAAAGGQGNQMAMMQNMMMMMQQQQGMGMGMGGMGMQGMPDLGMGAYGGGMGGQGGMMGGGNGMEALGMGMPGMGSYGMGGMAPQGMGGAMTSGGGGGNKGAPVPPNCNLYLYHLPVTWTDDDIRLCFAPFGTIVSAVVMKDRSTGASKGFGFVGYDNPASAQCAIQSMNGMQIDGKRLKVELKGSKGANPY